MKNKWPLFFSITIALVLILCLVGCSPSGDEITEAYQKGYDQGYATGYDAGYNEGYTKDLDGNSEIPPPGNTIPWNEAINHVGEKAVVRGTVEGTYWATDSNGKPTFLNIGKDYPASDRFVVVIWEDDRSNFPQAPESYYAGKTICVQGLIQEYEGVAEIEVTSPEQIEEC